MNDNFRIGSLGNAPVVPRGSGAVSSVPGFADTLRGFVDEVNSRLVAADKATADLAAGRGANIHETMIALEKANVSFRLLTKVQSKAVAAYQEIMRLQL